MSNSRVWVRRAGKFGTVIESADFVRWTRRYQELGTLELEARRAVDGASLLVDSLGDEISVVDTPGATVPDLTFAIESVTLRQGERGLVDDIVEVRGVEAGLFHARVALPPPHSLPLSGVDSHHEITGDAESAMREIVDNNAGPSAPSNRQYPNLVIAANQNRGASRTWKARFEVLSEKLATWAKLSDLGYEVQYDAGNDQHTFTVLQGSDVSAKVEFSVRLNNIETQEWKENGSDKMNFAWIAGQGEGTARDMDSTFSGGSEPSGKDRREMFVDARDLSDSADLEPRGDEKLAERLIEESFSIALPDSSPFVYRTDWGLGDIVTVKNIAWGLEKTKRIMEVETTVENDRIQRKITLGRPERGIVRRVRDAVGDQGTSRQ